jgi:hypothetical protein
MKLWSRLKKNKTRSSIAYLDQSPAAKRAMLKVA